MKIHYLIFFIQYNFFIFVNKFHTDIFYIFLLTIELIE